MIPQLLVLTNPGHTDGLHPDPPEYWLGAGRHTGILDLTGEGDGVEVELAVGVAVAVDVPLGVGDTDGDALDVADGVAVVDCVGVALDVDVADGVCGEGWQLT